MYLATSTCHLQTLLPKYQVFTHHERIETMNLKMKVLFPRPIYFVDSKDTNTFRGIVIQREFLSLVATSRHPPCSPITAGSTQLFVPCFVGVASAWHRGRGDTWHNLQKLCKFFRKLGLFSIFLTSINVGCDVTVPVRGNNNCCTMQCTTYSNSEINNAMKILSFNRSVSSFVA